MSVLKIFGEDTNHQRILADELNLSRRNWFIGWKCLAGVKSLVIEPDGSIFSANCKSIGTYGKHGSYGNVFTTFSLDDNPINCARRFCETEFDLAIPKYHKPKFRELHESESKEALFVETPVALDSEVDPAKKILWNMSKFTFSSMSKWKDAAHRLERFLKGEVGRFILQDPPHDVPEFFDFLAFLIHEKGHRVTVEGSFIDNPDFFRKALHHSDICLRLDGDYKPFFAELDPLGRLHQELHEKRIFRKVIVQVDLEHPEYQWVKSLLRDIPYNMWLEPGYFLKKHIPVSQPKTQVIPAKPEIVPAKIEQAEAARISKSGSRILLFIPMRNCSSTITKVIEGLTEELLEYIDEILVLDNDSTDDSLQKATEAAKKIRNVKVIVRRNDKNYGFGGSHKLALQHAHLNSMDYILIVHGDNSGSAQDFLPLFQHREFSGYDFVFGSRLSLSSRRENYPFYRLFANWILNFLASFVTASVVSDFSGAPVNLYRVQTLMNKFENPLRKFDDRILFGEDVFLYASYRRARIRFQPIAFREAGGKSFYSASTQFVRSVLVLLRYLVAKRKLFS